MTPTSPFLNNGEKVRNVLNYSLPLLNAEKKSEVNTSAGPTLEHYGKLVRQNALDRVLNKPVM